MLFSELKRNVDTPIGKQILYIYLLKINHQATFYHFFIFETRFNSLNVFMLKHIFCLLFQLSKKNAILSWQHHSQFIILNFWVFHYFWCINLPSMSQCCAWWVTSVTWWTGGRYRRRKLRSTPTLLTLSSSRRQHSKTQVGTLYISFGDPHTWKYG